MSLPFSVLLAVCACDRCERLVRVTCTCCKPRTMYVYCVYCVYLQCVNYKHELDADSVRCTECPELPV